MSKALPPGNDNSNQPEQTGSDKREQVPNEQQVSWENCIHKINSDYPDLFQWLLDLFGINSLGYYKKQKDLEDAITNPQTLFNGFYKLQQNQKALDQERSNIKLKIERDYHLRKFLVELFKIKSWLLWDEVDELGKAMSSPEILFEAFSKMHQNIDRNEKTILDLKHQLNQQTQEIKNLQQEREKLRTEKRSTTQLHTRIEELEKEKQELQGRVSSLLGKLAERDRDKGGTITSDDSRRQRDSLTQEFIQLNNQYFTAASNEIFNYRCQVNPELKEKRSQEIARIKSILAQQIFKSGSKLVINRNSQPQEEYLPQAIQLLTPGLLRELQIPDKADCPEKILKTLENLVSKGLNLVKDIVSDDPPGEFLIDNEGTAFNPEIHQPVPGCEPSGKILYTTYPGYRVNNRIVGEALKAFVFTVSEEPAPSADSPPTAVQQPTEPLVSTNDDIHLQSFSGRVTVELHGLWYRKSRNLKDTDVRTVINGQIVDFDAWAEGEMAEYKGKESNKWFRVAKTELWFPSVCIHLDDPTVIGTPAS